MTEYHARVPDGLRDRLSRALGRRTRLPPPSVSAAAAPGLKSALLAFDARSPERFTSLFLYGRPLVPEDHERSWLRDFERAGLLRKKLAGFYLPCVRVFPLLGAMIATDLLSHRDPDQVFSLMLEQVYVVRNLSVRAGDRVLELCVGSGVNSLFAADRAGSVTAVDISPRALAFARFNATLNPGGAPLELLEGSLFEPLAPDARFDVVIINPPFELVPPGTQHFLHSDGGADGLDVVRTCLAEAPRRLAPGGRFEIVTATPADADHLLLEDLLREAFTDHHIEIHDLSSEPIDDAVAQFRGRPGFAAWRDGLIARGIARLHLVFARATHGGPPGVEIVRPVDEVERCLQIVDGWS